MPQIRIAPSPNDHVAALSPALVDVASGGSVLANRCDDLEELIAFRKESVPEPEVRDSGVSVRDCEAEHRLELLDHALELARDQTDLPQP